MKLWGPCLTEVPDNPDCWTEMDGTNLGISQYAPTKTSFSHVCISLIPEIYCKSKPGLSSILDFVHSYLAKV